MTAGAKAARRRVPVGDSKAEVPPNQLIAEATLAMDAAIDEVKEKLRDCL